MAFVPQVEPNRAKGRIPFMFTFCAVAMPSAVGSPHQPREVTVTKPSRNPAAAVTMLTTTS